MDPQIEELKELVRRSISLSEDNNKMLHSMRRSAWVSRFMRLIWIAIIVVASVYSYLYFQPYIDQILTLYGNIQDLQQKAQGLLSQPLGQ